MKFRVGSLARDGRIRMGSSLSHAARPATSGTLAKPSQPRFNSLAPSVMSMSFESQSRHDREKACAPSRSVACETTSAVGTISGFRPAPE
jgi:hypothetical protein